MFLLDKFTHRQYSPNFSTKTVRFSVVQEISNISRSCLNYGEIIDTSNKRKKSIIHNDGAFCENGLHCCEWEKCIIYFCKKFYNRCLTGF